FLPVILASVSGAAIAQAVFGEGIAFSVNLATTETAIRSIHMTSLWELPYIALAGVVVAVFAALIIRLQLLLCRFQHLPIALRLSLAGLISGAVALYIPHIMGVGYDTVKAAIFGDLGLNLLLLIIAAKLFVTATGIGLGMPGGIIGPTLVIGACLGGVLEIVGNTLSPLSFDGNIDTGIYVLLGMSAMMAAVLNAPLAALMAVLELTYNPNMIFPTMLIIVIACITTRQVFGCEGIFLAQLAAGGRSVQFKPLFQVLRRAGVRSVMDTRFVCSSQMISYDEAKNVLSNHPMWVVVEELNKDKYLLRATDLAAYLDQASEQELALEKDIDLLEIPARRYKPLPIHQQANLYEAQKLLQKGAEALYVERLSSPLTTPVMGIVTHSTIDNYYQV
ncbi:MAG: chloride channel protein, partial [Exilibacterium sp.]